MNKKKMSCWNVWLLYPARTILILLGTVLLTLGNIYLRWCAGGLVDGIQDGSGDISENIASLLSTGIPIAVFLLVLAPPLAGYKTIFTARIQETLYRLLEHHILYSTAASLEQQAEGTITTYFTKDVGEVNGYIGRIMNKALPDAAKWLLTVELFFFFHIALGFTAIGITVGISVLLSVMSKAVARGAKEYQEAMDALNQGITSGLYNIEAIKASCREDKFLADDRKRADQLQKAKRRLAMWQAVLGAPMLLTAFETTIVLAWVGGFLVLRGELSSGQMLTVITLIDFIVTPIMSLDGTISVIRRTAVSLKRLNTYLGQEVEKLSEEAKEVSQIEKISFENITFSYPGQPEKKVFSAFTESWTRGHLYIMKGGNGEGKSTLLKLLMGAYPISGGKLCINDIPFEEFSLKSIRGHIVAVTQENVLFTGTIYENLVFGSEAAEEEVEGACKRVGIHDEIMHMEGQYQHVLTEDGGTLSGGQKQRICLARALLRKGDVYLLDEPTSAIDEHNRVLFLETVKQLAREKIVVIVTHDKDLLGASPYVTQIGG